MSDVYLLFCYLYLHSDTLHTPGGLDIDALLVARVEEDNPITPRRLVRDILRHLQIAHASDERAGVNQRVEMRLAVDDLIKQPLQVCRLLESDIYNAMLLYLEIFHINVNFF